MTLSITAAFMFTLEGRAHVQVCLCGRHVAQLSPQSERRRYALSQVCFCHANVEKSPD
jgi:hypothetical protein